MHGVYNGSTTNGWTGVDWTNNIIRMYDVDTAAMPYIKILTVGWQILTQTRWWPNIAYLAYAGIILVSIYEIPLLKLE